MWTHKQLKRMLISVGWYTAHAHLQGKPLFQSLLFFFFSFFFFCHATAVLLRMCQSWNDGQMWQGHVCILTIIVWLPVWLPLPILTATVGHYMVSQHCFAITEKKINDNLSLTMLLLFWRQEQVQSKAKQMMFCLASCKSTGAHRLLIIFVLCFHSCVQVISSLCVATTDWRVIYSTKTPTHLKVRGFLSVLPSS